VLAVGAETNSSWLKRPLEKAGAKSATSDP